MELRHVAVLVLVAAVAAAALVMCSPDEGPENAGDVRSISYPFDDPGEDWPETYVEGTYTELPFPSADGMTFAGWFADSGLTEPVGALTEDARGDITLYPKWIDSIVGTGYSIHVSGTYYNGSLQHSMDGTKTLTYAVQKDGMYYVQYHTYMHYRFPSGSSTSDNGGGYWTDGSPEGVYVGNGYVGGTLCQIWESAGERIWMKDMHLVMRTESANGPDGVTGMLAQTFELRPDTGFIPDVSAESPLDVLGAGEAEIGDTVTLEAVGDRFSGWYIDGEFFTDDRVLEIRLASPGHRYEARSTDDFIIAHGGLDLADHGFRGDAMMSGPDGTETPVQTGWMDLAVGYYEFREPSSSVSRTLYVYVDESRRFSWQWEHDGSAYEVGLTMQRSDVFRYSLLDPFDDMRFLYGTYGEVVRYFTVDDPYISEIGAQLRDLGSGMDRAGFARFVLSFVQSMPYVSDPDSHGQSEYWKYPSETIWELGGDCEDSSILYAVLMESLGYDSAITVFMGHAMAAVAVDGVAGQSVTIGDTVYTLCETTQPGYGLGETFDDREYNGNRVLYAYGIAEGRGIS